MNFPRLDLLVSEILRLFSYGELLVIRNERTFEPYFKYNGSYYFGDDNDFWNYISKIRHEDETYLATNPEKF
jgi:hypothetical protein